VQDVTELQSAPQRLVAAPTGRLPGPLGSERVDHRNARADQGGVITSSGSEGSDSFGGVAKSNAVTR
jgi:hypothetical protein